MTSITSSSTALYGAQRQSPRDRLQSELTAEVAAGTISSTDENALSTALDAIDKTLSAGRASGTSSTTPPSPDEMKQKISDLIGQQVEDGSLTADQAKALQSVFDDAFSGGPGGAGGPPPGPPPSDASASSSTSSGSDAIDELLKALQDAIASKSQYGSSGTQTTASTAATGKVLDLVA